MFRALKGNLPLAGILCIAGGMTTLSFQDALIKSLSGGYPLHQIVFTRSAIALILTLYFIHLEGGFKILKTHQPGLHFARGILLLISNLCYFTALAVMQLGEAMAIFFVAPLCTTLLSVPILGEKIGPWRIGAILVGIVGVVIVLRPGQNIFGYVALLPIGAALTYALMQVLTRRLGATDKASAMAFYVQLIFLIFSAAMGLGLGDGRYAGGQDDSVEFLVRAWRWPETYDLMIMVACGLLVAVTAYLLSQAYRLAEANLVAPFEYIALPMAVIWGYLMWREIPDGIALIGISVIIASGLFLAYREFIQAKR